MKLTANIKNIGLVIGLLIFAIFVFKLSTGWFVIVISIFAAITLAIILLSTED